MTPSPDTSPLAAVVAPFGRARTYSSLAYLVAGIPLGIAWFVLLVVGWSVGAGLLVTLVGIPIILGLLYASRWAVELERRFANAALGAGIPRPRRTTGRGIRGLVTDPATWRDQAFLAVRAVAGFGLGVATVAVVSAPFNLISYPFWYWAVDDDNRMAFGVWSVNSLPEALAAAAAGVVLLIAVSHLIVPAGRMWAAIARGILSPAARDPQAGARGRRPPSAVGGAAHARRAIGVHAAVWSAFAALFVIIWAATMASGYFWPVWPMLGLGLFLAVHAVVVLRPSAGTGDMRRAGIEIHVGIMAVLTLLLVAIWAITTPGGYPWFLWAFIGLAVPPIAHGIILLARPGERAALEHRVEILTTTRAGAVDAQAAELQRIERDLHDGAQARLVALAMDLGRAEAQMDTDPERAREIMLEARDQATMALSELRDLARGIYPPVLTDRGLTAAVTALAARTPMSVVVDGPLTERPAPAVEAAAYFVAAEALANAAKHSRATHVAIAIARHGDVLTIEVRDDGVGGADPAGSGLTGLRRRVEALDGTTAVISPAGGPTVVTATLPWGRPTGEPGEAG